MFRSYLENTSLAWNASSGSVKCSIQKPDLSLLLKKFKNFGTDEFSTVDDDGMAVPPLACAFAKMPQNQHILSAVDEDGYLVLYNTYKTARDAIIKTWQVHANAVFDLEWLQQENKILTGSGDQTIALNDVATCQKVETFRGHASSIKSVSCRVGDDAVFSSGSRDGHIMTWDKRIFHKDGAIPPINTISNAHTIQPLPNLVKTRRKCSSLFRDTQQSVTCVLYQNENYLISAGAVDGCLKIWDIRKTYRVMLTTSQPVYVFHYPGTNTRKHGYSSLVQDSYGLRLFASCTDDTIYEFDIHKYSETPVHCWTGHKNRTFYVKSALSPDDNYLLSGSSDDFAYIWQVNKPTAPPVVLKSHTAEVSSVAWCPNDITKVVTLSDDTKTKLWRIYCRELDELQLPSFVGQASRMSKLKEKGTSTSSVHLASPVTPVASPSGETKTPTHSAAGSSGSCKASKSPSVREWLKRKSKLTDSYHKLVPSLNQKLKMAETHTDKAEDTSRPLFSNDEAVKAEKRKYTTSDDEDKLLHTIDSCKKVKTEHSDHPMQEEIRDEPLATSDAQCDSDSVGGSKHSEPSLKTSEDSIKPLTSPRKSPSKRNKTFRGENGENRPELQSTRCVRLDSSEEATPVMSPPRACLGNLESNRQCDLRSPHCSVKISLFQDTLQNLKYSSHSALKGFANDSSVNDTKEQLMDLSTANATERLTTPSKLPSEMVPDHDSPTRCLPNLVQDEIEGRKVTPTRLEKTTARTPKQQNWLTKMRLDKLTRSVPHTDDKGAKQVRAAKPATKDMKGMKKIQSYFTVTDSS